MTGRWGRAMAPQSAAVRREEIHHGDTEGAEVPCRMSWPASPAQIDAAFRAETISSSQQGGTNERARPLRALRVSVVKFLCQADARMFGAGPHPTLPHCCATGEG